MMKLKEVCVRLPQDLIYLRDVDAIEVEIWLDPKPDENGKVVFMLSVDCQSVIERFMPTDFHDGSHTMNDDCLTCESLGWVNEECEADCYHSDTIAMDAFEDCLADISELRMFSKGVEHCIEHDHWTITAMRSEN